MCGIVGGFNVGEKATWRGVKALLHRGPDAQAVKTWESTTLGHARLSIIDVTSASNQPFMFGNVLLSYNGEMWNYRSIREELHATGYRFRTTGDTEVMAAAIQAWGDDAFRRLQGMWAVAWTSDRGETIRLCRDRFGEIPLHVAVDGARFWFASEKKGLAAMGAPSRSWKDVQPGTIVAFDGYEASEKSWYDAPVSACHDDMDVASAKVRNLVRAGTLERTVADVPVCTLLSGGIDSSAVLLDVKEQMPDITAYAAVMNPKSPDLKAARRLAEELEIRLVEVKIPPPTADSLSGVVRAIEMPFKAQVEIGWACIHLADAMRRDGFKVTFSGEGSDELWASYGFAYHALKKKNWHDYRKELILDQARKNFARCNKIFMAASVECRLPFLHVPLVEYALSLRRGAVQDGSRSKAVMQEAYRGILPDWIVKRQKLAFQDGTGMKSAAARAVADPKGFYAAEYKKLGAGIEIRT